MLAAEALHEGPGWQVFVRVAPLADGADGADGTGGLSGVVIDLADPNRHVVVVTADGWRVALAVQVGVRFLRTPGTLPLPLPRPGERPTSPPSGSSRMCRSTPGRWCSHG